jgi:hypothetical protein
MKSRRIRWATNTCSTHGRNDKCMNNFSQKTRKEVLVGDLDVDARIILKWILNKCVAKFWSAFICLGVVSNDGLF